MPGSEVKKRRRMNKGVQAVKSKPEGGLEGTREERRGKRDERERDSLEIHVIESITE